MASRSFLSWFKFSWFKVNVKFLSKLSFRQRRKPKPPSPTRRNTLTDCLAHDVSTYGLVGKERTSGPINLDPNLWREILSHCDVIDIIHVGMTCRSLASVAEDHRVWYFALLRICHNKRLPFHIESLPYAALRQKAILSARLDQISRGLDLRPFPYTITALSLQVSIVWGISFLPGGEWLVVICRRADEDGIMLCRANGSSDQPCAYISVPDWHLTNMHVFTSSHGDLLLLLCSHCFHAMKLDVYLIHPSCTNPILEMVWTVEAAEIENCDALEDYIVYGWTDRSSTNPRHLIKVSKLKADYRQRAESCMMEVEWDVAKWSHSYGLRITDSEIIVVVSSTKLVAAYKVPLMVPASTPCEPVTVAPLWRFSCAHLNPRAVYLVPSIPAADTPSVIILYGNRCLFISPGFDTDPLQRHPTYFSTYTYPRELGRPMLLGSHRAFWDLGGGKVGIGILPTPITPGFYEDGLWDMTGIHVPEGNLANDVHPLGRGGLCKGKVVKAAWDEESGKLVLCPRADSGMAIIVDLKP